jgi:hypothetical protein
MLAAPRCEAQAPVGGDDERRALGPCVGVRAQPGRELVAGADRGARRLDRDAGAELGAPTYAYLRTTEISSLSV